MGEVTGQGYQLVRLEPGGRPKCVRSCLHSSSSSICRHKTVYSKDHEYGVRGLFVAYHAKGKCSLNTCFIKTLHSTLNFTSAIPHKPSNCPHKVLHSQGHIFSQDLQLKFLILHMKDIVGWVNNVEQKADTGLRKLHCGICGLEIGWERNRNNDNNNNKSDYH